MTGSGERLLAAYTAPNAKKVAVVARLQYFPQELLDCLFIAKQGVLLTSAVNLDRNLSL